MNIEMMTTHNGAQQWQQTDQLNHDKEIVTKVCPRLDAIKKLKNRLEFDFGDAASAILQAVIEDKTAIDTRGLMAKREWYR